MLRLMAHFARGVARAAGNKRTAPPPLIMDGFREGGELRGREEVEGADLFVPPPGKEGGILFAL